MENVTVVYDTIHADKDLFKEELAISVTQGKAISFVQDTFNNKFIQAALRDLVTKKYMEYIKHKIQH